MPKRVYKSFEEFAKEYAERRKRLMLKMRERGTSDQRIGERFQVSRQRVFQICGPRNPQESQVQLQVTE